MLKKKLRNQKGFTLIEIIAVLVILGILAAVAIPKFMDLQGEAKIKSIDGALAAGGSNAFMQYSRGLLANTYAGMDSATIITRLRDDLNSTTAGYDIVGDFKVLYSVGTATAPCTMALTVTGVAGPPNYITTYVASWPSKTFCIQ